MAVQLDTEPANFIYMDLFPAQVEEYPNFGDQLRIITTDNYFYIIRDEPTGPALLLKEALVSFEGTTKTGYTIVTEIGTYSVTKAPNCGCGTRLRGLHPFMGVPFVSQLGKK